MSGCRRLLMLGGLPLLVAGVSPAQALVFTSGDLVVSLSGNGNNDGSYADNQASPVVLQQLTTAGVLAGSMVLPQVASGANFAFSGEYGSSSEGSLTRSVDGKSLVIAGYGVNAATYNAGGATVYGNAAEAQSTSVPGGTYTAVPRVVANIRADGTVDTSTALYNVYNTNNPRSVATVDGTSFYLGGQGVKGDTTQGVFYAKDGASTATAIDTSSDVRTTALVNGQLYVSRDSTQSADGILNYGTAPTAATTGTLLAGIGPTVTVGANNNNGANASRSGTTAYLSPENYFFANSNTLYIADSGRPKGGSAGKAGLGDGGLQKWVLSNGTWTMAYDLYNGLNLVMNSTTAGVANTTGTTGLIGLAGVNNGDGTVSLYATNATLGDTDQTYLYGITDSLTATSAPASEVFNLLYTAPADTNVRGVAFAPTLGATAVPEPAALAVLAVPLAAVALRRRR